MSSFSSIFLTLTSILTLQTAANAHCFFTAITVKPPGSTAKCVYEDLEYRIGTQFRITDCYMCACHSAGFACCGFGTHKEHFNELSGQHEVEYDCDDEMQKDAVDTFETSTLGELEATLKRA